MQLKKPSSSTKLLQSIEETRYLIHCANIARIIANSPDTPCAFHKVKYYIEVADVEESLSKEI